MQWRERQRLAAKQSPPPATPRNLNHPYRWYPEEERVLIENPSACPAALIASGKIRKRSLGAIRHKRRRLIEGRC